MLACLVPSAAELFKGGIFITDNVFLLACGVEYVYVIQNWAVSHSFVTVQVLSYIAAIQSQKIYLQKGRMTLKRVWPGIKKKQRTCRGEFVNLNWGIRGGRLEVYYYFADIDYKYMRHKQVQPTGGCSQLKVLNLLEKITTGI
jgi:hypothetical protein